MGSNGGKEKEGREVEGGGRWREVEGGGGWRDVEGRGGRWRVVEVEGCRGRWREVEAGGGERWEDGGGRRRKEDTGGIILNLNISEKTPHIESSIDFKSQQISENL
jgi:hypothetical protein